MPDEKKKPLHPETNFLPPLDMVLSFFKKKEKPDVHSTVDESDEVQGHAVKRIIDRITHDDQQHADQKTND